MDPRSHCQPVPVNTGSADEQGCLVFVDGRLVALLVRLSDGAHDEPELWGRWFLEAGLGPCRMEPREVTFASCEQAQAWARERVATRGGEVAQVPSLRSS